MTLLLKHSNHKYQSIGRLEGGASTCGMTLIPKVDKFPTYEEIWTRLLVQIKKRKRLIN